MKSVLVIGSANYDLVWRSPKLPNRGETVLGTSFTTFPGGKGANQAVAAGKLGADVYFCGCVGEDAFGDELIASLQSANVKTDFVRRVPTPSGNAAIIVDDQGANQIVVAPGANAELRPYDVLAAIESLNPAFVLAQLEIPMDTVLAASKASAMFILNPAPARELAPELIANCFALVPNESEMAVLTNSNSTDYESLGQELLHLGAQNLVVTLGSQGALWLANGIQERCAGVKVDAIDTTAAGDVFCGALLTQLAEGSSIGEALPFANAAAAVSVTRPGAQASAPTRNEVEALISRMN